MELLINIAFLLIPCIAILGFTLLIFLIYVLYLISIALKIYISEHKGGFTHE